MKLRRWTLQAPAMAGALCAYAPNTHASGLAIARFGGELGHPTTPSPIAVAYNPAALTTSKGTTLYLEGQAVLSHMGYFRPVAPTDVPDPAGAAGANAGTAKFTNFLAAPGLAASTRVQQFAFGAALYAPFGGALRFEKNAAFANSAYPGPYDGVQRWSGISGNISSVYLTGAAAYRFEEPRLSIGFSGSLIRSAQKAAFAYTANGDNDVTAEGRYFVDVAGLQFGFGAGVLFEAVEDRLWLGVSYEASPRPSVLSGDLHKSLPGGGGATTDPIESHSSLPDIARGGLRYAPSPRLELRLFGNYTRWSVFNRVCLSAPGKNCDVRTDGSAPPGSGALVDLPRNWKDTAAIRAGVSYWTSKHVELFAGAGFDSNPVPDTTLDVSSMAGANLSFSVGMRIELTQRLSLMGSYTHLYFLPRDNIGKSELPYYLMPSRQPDSGGKYALWIAMAHVGIAASF